MDTGDAGAIPDFRRPRCPHPHRARFNAYPRQPEIASESLGQAGDRLENGDDYRPGDIRAVAAELLRERKQA